MFPLALLNASSPPSPPVDPSLTLALLHFDGANNSTVFTDSSPTPLTYTRTLSENIISTAQSKFGGASLYVGSTSGSGVVSQNNDRFLLTNQNFTIECWFYDSVLVAGNKAIIGVGDRHSIAIDNGTIKGNVYTGSNFEIVHQTTVGAAVWNHVALVRNNGVVTLYVNGAASNTTVAIGTTSLINDGNNFFKMTPASYKGVFVGGFDGYIDEARFRKEAVYTADFTPPTSPFTY
ncbi:MAG: LamG domain-containing protein [Agitococcus sp.]|nr:LamG domain-containing protein [Agitococcus sp.]